MWVTSVPIGCNWLIWSFLIDERISQDEDYTHRGCRRLIKLHIQIAYPKWSERSLAPGEPFERRRDSRDAEHRRTTSHTFSHLLNLDDLQILDTLPFSISLTRHFVGRIAGRTLCARTHKKRPTLLILSVWRFTRRPAAGWKSSADRNLFKAFKNKSKVCSFLKLNFNGGFAN